METFRIAFAVGLLVFLASLLTLYGLFRKKVNLEERLLRTPVRSDENNFAAFVKRVEQFLIPVGEMLPRSPAEMSRQERRLVQAGIRRKDGVLLLNGAHVITVALA